MMRSMYSGVAGLKVHQTKMDVIGNNIANVNTIGFKSQKVSFSDLFYQTSQIASGPNEEGTKGGSNARQVGLGTTVAQISTNITDPGGTQSTGNALDVMINGSSFFIIQGDDGGEYYSKAGNFTTDGSGNLVTGGGNYVMGYTAAKDPDTGDYTLQKDKLRPVSIYGAEYMTTEPAQTTSATLSGNINAQDDAFDTKGSGIISTKLYAFDSLGNKYGVQFDIKKVSSTEYTLKPSTIYNGPTVEAGMSAVFSGDGVNADGSVTLTFDGTKGTITNDPARFTLNITDGSANLPSFASDITVDFSSMTSYGSSTSVSANAGIDNLGAGKAVGNMTSYGISDDGSVVASYTNGDVVTIGQLVTAQFSNPSGLEKAGNNLFAQTLNSGTINYQTIDAAGESMTGGAVEMSNVDLATEFTDMIVTQRGFQANSRIITTSDSMIEELLSLKR